MNPDNTDYIHIDDAFDYIISNHEIELIEYVCENKYETIRDYVFKQEEKIKQRHET